MKRTLIIAGGVILVLAILFGVGWYVGSGGNLDVAGKLAALKEAQDEVSTLRGQLDSSEKEWSDREAEYQGRITRLNGQVTKLKKDYDALKIKMAKLGEERAKIVIPTDPGGICPEFVKAGYKSCTRLPARANTGVRPK